MIFYNFQHKLSTEFIDNNRYRRITTEWVSYMLRDSILHACWTRMSMESRGLESVADLVW